MPYLYTLAYLTACSGHPLVRPLFWEFPLDPKLKNVQDTFMLGNALLVAPVTKSGASTIHVILPESSWYCLYTHMPYRGFGHVNLEAELDTISVLVKAGTILPRQKEKKLILMTYAHDQGHLTRESLLYSDAGDGYGDSRLDRFTLSAWEQGFRITWNSEGNYPLPYQEIELHLIGAKPAKANIDGRMKVFQAGKLTQVTTLLFAVNAYIQ